MDSLFPPYNALAIKDDHIYPDWGGICRTIPGIPKSQKEDIAKLIMEHWRLSLMRQHAPENAIKSMLSSGIPYHGKTAAGGKGLIINVSKLPADLQMIIARYVINNTIS